MTLQKKEKDNNDNKNNTQCKYTQFIQRGGKKNLVFCMLNSM